MKWNIFVVALALAVISFGFGIMDMSWVVGFLLVFLGLMMFVVGLTRDFEAKKKVLR